MSNLVDVIPLSKKNCRYPIQCELAYATPNNLVGRILSGYYSDATDICLLTKNAAHALCEVQNYLISQHQVGLFVFDAYRPKRAVLDFVKWSREPVLNDFELSRKQLHYPHIEKNQLFKLGYIAEDSNHCYGNTVDLALIDLKTHHPLDMGAIFDFMDVLSHHTATKDDIGETAFRNRQILMNAMQKFGFEPYELEYWHYCHGGMSGREIVSPMDIEITANLRG